MRAFAPLVWLLPPVAAMALLYGGPMGAVITAAAALGIGVLSILLYPRAPAPFVEKRHVREVPRDVTFLTTVILAAFAVRLVLAITLRVLDLNQVVGGDEGTFDVNARYFALWLEGRAAAPFQRKWIQSGDVGYFVMVGLMYRVVGFVPWVPVIVNCAIGSATALPAYHLAARIGGSAAGRAAGVLVAFFPSLVLWSSLLVRDAPAFFLILSSVAIAQQLVERVTPARIALLLLSLAGLGTLRSYIFLLVAVSIVAGYVVAGMRRPVRAFAVAAIAALGTLVLIRSAGLGADLIQEVSLERLDLQRRLNAIGGTASIGFAGHDISTPTGALTYLPIGLVYFLVAPFPWDLGGRQFMALPDVVAWYACIPLVVVGIAYGLRRRRRHTVIPLLAASSIILFYALVEGNVGIIVRHRAQVLVILLPFAAVGWVRRKARLARAARERQQIEATTLRRRLSPAGIA